MLKFLDLFSGVGGFRLAFERFAHDNGFSTKCVGYSEINKFAKLSYESNFDIVDELDLGDITKISDFDLKDKNRFENDINTKIPEVDMIFAGFPCQPFSMMGYEKGFRDERGKLFFYLNSIIAVKRPRLFILENVRGLKNHDNGKTIEKIEDQLRKNGYSVTIHLLNTRDYGLPQVRRRLFIIGVRDDFSNDAEIIAPPVVDLKTCKYPTIFHLLEKKVDKKYYILPKTLKIILADGSGKYRAKSVINQIIGRPLTATMHKMHRASQDNYYSDDFINGEYDDDLNDVIRNCEYDHNIRKLTPKEAFLMQGFPQNFVDRCRDVGISDTQLYRQAGNAVSVDTVYHLITHIFRIIPYIFS